MIVSVHPGLKDVQEACKKLGKAYNDREQWAINFERSVRLMAGIKYGRLSRPTFPLYWEKEDQRRFVVGVNHKQQELQEVW